VSHDTGPDTLRSFLELHPDAAAYWDRDVSWFFTAGKGFSVYQYGGEGGVPCIAVWYGTVRFTWQVGATLWVSNLRPGDLRS